MSDNNRLDEYLDKPLADKEWRIVEDTYEKAHSEQRIAALEARNAELERELAAEQAKVKRLRKAAEPFTAGTYITHYEVSGATEFLECPHCYRVTSAGANAWNNHMDDCALVLLRAALAESAEKEAK